MIRLYLIWVNWSNLKYRKVYILANWCSTNINPYNYDGKPEGEHLGYLDKVSSLIKSIDNMLIPINKRFKIKWVFVKKCKWIFAKNFWVKFVSWNSSWIEENYWVSDIVTRWVSNFLEFSVVLSRKLRLKVDVPVLFMRNIEAPSLWCNTATNRTPAMQHFKTKTMVTGIAKCEDVSTPRFPIILTSLPFHFNRVQF